MAEPAKEPLPYMNKNILLFGFLGLIITVSSVLAYEYFDTTVKSTRDIKEKIGLKLLAVIPDTGIKQGRHKIMKGKDSKYTTILSQNSPLILGKRMVF